MRLRSIGMAWVLLGFALGLSAASVWLLSGAAWQRHLQRAEAAGVATYHSLRDDSPAPEGVLISPLSAQDAALAENGAFTRLRDAPRPAFVTNISIRSDGPGTPSGEALVLAVVSADLRYSLATLSAGGVPGAAEKLGRLTRLLASYCSRPILYARMDQGRWQRIDGSAVWGCAVAPTDYRLVAGLGAVVVLAGLLSHVVRISGAFDAFAQALRHRRRLGGPEAYAEEGPEELRETVQAVNAYLEAERAALDQRARVLSGVSHDLGTPATRLRLRAALIEDDALRDKLERDIDRMTGMIESVLTYTRSEMAVEAPRALSLTALVEALVADYQDMGKPVQFHAAEPVTVQGGRSLFMSRAGEAALPEARRVLVTGMPISLQRAVSNLIDNALKYGRRACVSVEAQAETAAIIVEDEGDPEAAEEIGALVAPFIRGANSAGIEGFGMGLTIVVTVAEQHGGRLSFESGARGLRARFEIARG